MLFDGVCHLCDRTVLFVLKRDRGGLFHFAPLQSEFARGLLHRHDLPQDSLESVVLVEVDGSVSTHSTAILRVFAKLPLPWKLLAAFRVVPVFVRDAVYRWIARNRYRWFGRRETCHIPRPEWVDRFHE